MEEESIDMDQARAVLLAQRAKLKRHLNQNIEDLDELNAPDELLNQDTSDLAEEYAERERDLALSAIELDQLKEIEAALARIDAGTYGICANCGNLIPAGRLQILPYATHCVTCQSQRKDTF